MKRRSVVLINLLALILFFLTLFLITNGKIFKPSITGFAFAEFYTADVIYIENPISNEITTFRIPIQNKKDSNLEEVYATVEITDINQNRFALLESKVITIEPNSVKDLSIEWDNNVPEGTYIANIYISSKDVDAAFTRQFEIEPRTLSIESILVKDFELGESIEPEILIQNHLPKTLTEVKANLIIYDEDNNEITKLESNKTTIEPNAPKTLITTWNTKDLSPGKYNAKLEVESEGYSKNKDLIIEVEESNLNVIGTGFAINYTQEDSFDFRILIVSFVVLILLINIIIWLKNKNQKD